MRSAAIGIVHATNGGFHAAYFQHRMSLAGRLYSFGILLVV